MEELSNSVRFISDKLDEANNCMKDMSAQFAVIRKNNEELRAINTDLTKEVVDLRDRVRSIEQYSRRDNIEVSGLPVTKNEDVVSLVKDVAAAVGVMIREDDISTAHRVPSFKKERTPSLIVRFARRSTRDSILANYREKRGGMTARDVNPTFPQQRLYINEHLSPDNKVFLSKLKSKCKDIGYAYAWCRDGRFFVRKTQGDKYKRVDTYEELDKLK
ncbi:uncharacterized protein LOC124365134 [Homalodisca vitripennis]|uniref:uncharacterized protein LOC124365134 n=1 Tax=Homalodisca vitripennis TaxID=197043 RepID=UPI001EECB564|nr:uncharacterized protein LOC124365134 [Homalodisca vitripennis]